MSMASAADSTSGIVNTGGRGELRRALLVVMALSLLVGLPAAVPAAADHEPPTGEGGSHDAGGSGRLEGTELVEEQEGFPCFRVTRHLFGLRGAGTYEGRTAEGGPVVFRGEIGANETLHANGPLQVQIENTEVYYHSPFGTHGTEAGGGAGCSPTTVGNPVPAEFRVFAAEGTQDIDGDRDVDVLTGTAWVYRVNDAGDKVPCRAQGTFARGTKESPTFADPTAEAEWTLAEDCVVVGNEAGTPGTGSAPRGTFHTFHGEHEPCFGDATAGDCPRNIRHDYAQFLPKPGPFLTMTGPASVVVGCDEPVTVTARLTVTGWPEPDVPVTFTVTGPVPTVPPGGAGITGADGRAAFTFTAADAGDYTVTATATYDGQERVATHTVHFEELPPLSVTLTGPPRGQTEETTTVRATVRDACTTVPGATVEFSVAWTDQAKPWTGQPSPSSGTATTDELGQATFAFNGDRAGAYTVTATTSLGTEQASDTHTADLVINTLKRLGSIPLAAEGEPSPQLSAMDPAGRFAYFGTGTYSANKVVKFDLATFQRVGELPTPTSIGWLVIDPDGDYAYAGWGSRVHKLDLSTFQWVGTLTLPDRSNGRAASVGYAWPAIDPAGDHLYVASKGRYNQYDSDPSLSYPTQVLKIDLHTFQQVDAMDMQLGLEDWPSPAVMDPSGASAYFAFESDLGARVVKIDLSTFQRAGTALLSADERALRSGVIDPAGAFAYFGTRSGSPGRVVKVDLAAMQRVGAIILNEDRNKLGPFTINRSEEDLTTALMDPTGRYAYFGTRGRIGSDLHPAAVHVPARLIRIDLETFTRAESVELPHEIENESLTGVIDPTGTHAYLGASQADVPQNYGDPPRPGLVAKIRLFRPPSPALVADDDAYATDYESPLSVPAPGVLTNDSDTADNDPLQAGQATDPPGGSVTLNPDGGFTYTPDAGFAGTDAFTYTASDGMDYSAPATVSVAVAPPQGVTGRALGYHADEISLFGGAQDDTGPTPTVELASDGSNSPQDASASTGLVQYGPATLFTSDQIAVHTEGSLEPAASVATTSSIVNINKAATQPSTGSEIFTADSVSGSCTASGTGATGSTTVTNGTLRTHAQAGDHDEGVVAIPTDPPPNYTVAGHIHLDATTQDNYVVVFNEQTINPDGSLTVTPVHEYFGVTLDEQGNMVDDPNSVLKGHLYLGQVVCGAPASATPLPRAVADFNGDGSSDISVFRPSNGGWYIAGQTTTFHGRDGDVAVPADYDGDGDVDIGVFRPSTGGWYLQGQPVVFHGRDGDLPVPGDYDGDGDADMAVFRPSNGGWYVAGRPVVFFGRDGDIPVPGHYDADAELDLAVFRPANGGWYVQGQATVFHGRDGDVPVPGDYDGDGDTDVAVFRPANGGWYVEGQATVFHGRDGDVPVPGDYDGDGDVDIAVFRPSTGGWYRPGQATVFHGRNGDTPLPLPPAVHQAAYATTP